MPESDVPCVGKRYLECVFNGKPPNEPKNSSNATDVCNLKSDQEKVRQISDTYV